MLVLLTHHSFPGADQNINGVDFVQLESCLFVFFALDFVGVLNDRLFTVDLKLLQLMAEHSLDRFALVTLGDGLDHACYSVILEKANG